MKRNVDSKSQYVVIGAGLSALSGVLALLERGIRPIVIASESSMNSNTARKIHYDKRVFRQLKDYETQGHIYASPFSDTEVSLPNSPIAISSGMGGLSNVWGGGWQPINSEQYKWFSPKMAQQIQESSEKLLSFFKYSGHEDELNKRFPLPITNRVGHFCEQEYDYFNGKPKSIQSIDDVLFGFPRRLHCGSLCKTVHAEFDPLNAKHYFESLTKSNHIDFIQMRVLEIRGTSPLIVIGYDSEEIRHEIYCEKILLSAGTIASSAILLRSLHEIDKVEIHDSQMFYTAFLSIRRSPFGSRNKSEAFGNLISGGNTTKQHTDFSCSLIGPSKDFAFRISNLLPHGIGRILARDFIVHRLYMSIGFIDQDFSGMLLMEKQGTELKTRLVSNPASHLKIKQVRKLLRKWGFRRNLIILPWFLTPRATVGSGFHSGALSQMQKLIQSDSGENDLCEIGALKGVHLLDTSSIPKIPAGAHSFIAMVNAFRVGSRI